MPVKIPLAEMKKDETGKVVEFTGGKSICHRLKMLGIRPGSAIIMASTPFMRGPIIVRVGSTKTALGHGMSHKIFVEVKR